MDNEQNTTAQHVGSDVSEDDSQAAITTTPPAQQTPGDSNSGAPIPPSTSAVVPDTTPQPSAPVIPVKMDN